MNRTPGLQTEIQCPFFIAFGGGVAAKDSRSIICESPVVDAKSTSVYFQSRHRMKSHATWYCSCIDGGGCPIYRANMRKYEDKPDE